jgi:hypothetical protein
MTVADFEVIKLLRELTEKESDRFWTRNNVFVTINAGLLAFLAASYEKVPFFVFLGMCGFGIATSLAWYQISRAGKYYAQRWRLAARDLAASDDQLTQKAPLLAGVKNLDKPSGPSSSRCMMAMAIVATVIWLLLAGYGIATRGPRPSARDAQAATSTCVIIGERTPN